MVKRLFTLVVLTIVFASQLDAQSVQRVVVYKVNPLITTFSDTDCGTFLEKFAPEQFKVDIITDEEQCREIQKALTHIKFSRKCESLNTRAQIFIYFEEGGIRRICLDQFGNMQIGPTQVKKAKDLKKILLEIVGF